LKWGFCFFWGNKILIKNHFFILINVYLEESFIMKNSLLLFILFFFFCKNIVSQTYVAGETYFGSNDYIEYKAGNLPIVISAAHGGTLEPNEIPDRNCAGCSTVRDFATDDLARKMDDAIFTEFGCYPHVIINRLHRIKLDANREIVEAANGNSLAEQAWNEFHDFIDSAKDSTTTHFEKGIYLDIHGHGHDIQRLELGYLISKVQLQMSNAALDDEAIVDLSSIMNLVNDNLNGLSHSNLLRGENSLGELFEIETYPSVPSQTDPFPIGNEPYFSGGYNTRRHGSKEDGTIDGIQIECNRDGVRDTNSQRFAFAEATAKVLKQYLETHYFGNGGLNNACETVPIENVTFNNDFTFSISPNPTSNVLRIQSSQSQVVSVFITNHLGHYFYKKENIDLSDFTINTTPFPRGIYFLTIKNNQSQYSKKISLQ